MEPKRIVRAVRETLGGAAFDIKFLGEYLNKPGDGDFHLLGVESEMNRVTLRCRGGSRISIVLPGEVLVRDRTVGIVRAAKVELVIDEEVWGSIATESDDLVMRIPATPDRRIHRDTVLTPLAELVYVFASPPNLVDPKPSGLRGAVLLDPLPRDDDSRP